MHPTKMPAYQELKAQYKALTGEDWGGKPPEDKKVGGALCLIMIIQRA
jgi:hypothetical protein